MVTEFENGKLSDLFDYSCALLPTVQYQRTFKSKLFFSQPWIIDGIVTESFNNASYQTHLCILTCSLSFYLCYLIIRLQSLYDTVAVDYFFSIVPSNNSPFRLLPFNNCYLIYYELHNVEKKYWVSSYLFIIIIIVIRILLERQCCVLCRWMSRSHQCVLDCVICAGQVRLRHTFYRVGIIALRLGLRSFLQNIHNLKNSFLLILIFFFSPTQLVLLLFDLKKINYKEAS